MITSNIQTSTFSKPAVSAALDHIIVTLSANEWAIAHIAFYDEDGGLVARKEVPITQAESEQWGNDDSYLLQLALQKLEIIQAE